LIDGGLVFVSPQWRFHADVNFCCRSVYPPQLLPTTESLAIEVVSPDSQVRDRERKPQLYAASGIPHFWRVEENDGKPVVYVYELDPATSSYTPTGIYHERLTLTVPFPIDIDLGGIEQL
jgi:hypothetical protein